MDKDKEKVIMFGLSYHEALSNRLLKIMEKEGDIKVFLKENE